MSFRGISLEVSLVVSAQVVDMTETCRKMNTDTDTGQGILWCFRDWDSVLSLPGPRV